MVLVEKGGIARQAALEEGAERFIADAGRNQAVAGQDPARVGVDDEDRTARRVEEDGVRRLRADPRHGQEVRAQFGKGGALQTLEPPAEALPEKLEEGPEASRLDSVGSRRADQAGQLLRWKRAEPVAIQEPSCPEPRQGPLHVRPGRVLGENRADGDLQGALAGPPPLGTEVIQERGVEAEQPALEGICGKAPHGDPEYLLVEPSPLGIIPHSTRSRRVVLSGSPTTFV